MGKIAFLFAGQGAQAPGMGKSLYAMGGAAKAVFDTVESIRPGTLHDCFEADAQRLAQTDVTQPCVYTVGLACAAALQEAGIQPQGVAGFSLGEMGALTFAGAFPLAVGANLVRLRGDAMQTAAQKNPGAMAAVLRMDDEAVEALCATLPDVWPVNYNCPGQIVVAGRKEALPAFCDAVAAAGGRAKVLPVGGAFHTPLMQSAANIFLQHLQDAGMQPPTLPVYANLTAKPYTPPCEETLAAQMHNPVRWHACVRLMAQDGFTTFVEVGPGKTLSGFVKRILPEASVYNVQDTDSLHDTLQALKQPQA